MNLIKFKVSRWSVRPVVIEYSRETAHYYVRPNGDRDTKVSRYYVYFDTEAEALQHIAERQQAEQAAKRLKQIEKAAPDLLAALESCEELLSAMPTLGGIAGLAVVENARAAIAKATGGES